MKSITCIAPLLILLSIIPTAVGWFTVHAPVRGPDNFDQRNRPPMPTLDEIVSQRNRPSDHLLEPVAVTADGTVVIPRGLNLKHGHHGHRHPHGGRPARRGGF